MIFPFDELIRDDDDSRCEMSGARNWNMKIYNDFASSDWDENEFERIHIILWIFSILIYQMCPPVSPIYWIFDSIRFRKKPKKNHKLFNWAMIMICNLQLIRRWSPWFLNLLQKSKLARKNLSAASTFTNGKQGEDVRKPYVENEKNAMSPKATYLTVYENKLNSSTAQTAASERCIPCDGINLNGIRICASECEKKGDSGVERKDFDFSWANMQESNTHTQHTHSRRGADSEWRRQRRNKVLKIQTESETQNYSCSSRFACEVEMPPSPPLYYALHSAHRAGAHANTP